MEIRDKGGVRMTVESIEQKIQRTIEALERLKAEGPNIQRAADAIIKAYQSQPKGFLYICGNGGSATDTSHIAAELVGRYKLERKGLPALSLVVDPAFMTAWPNDYEFGTAFSRQVETFGEPKDILLAITTSDYDDEDKHSINLKNALIKAREIGMTTIGLYSIKSDRILDLTDIVVKGTSEETEINQTCHQVAYHEICKRVEAEMDKYWRSKE